MSLSLNFIFNTSLVIFFIVKCEGFKRALDDNEIYGRSQFRALSLNAKINKCCGMDEIYGLTEQGYIACVKIGESGLNFKSSLMRKFQYKPLGCLKGNSENYLGQSIVRDIRQLEVNDQGQLLYENDVYQDYCVEFDSTTNNNWLILHCLFGSPGVAKQTRNLNKCCQNDSGYLRNEFGDMICSDNYRSKKRSFSSKNEEFTLNYQSKLACKGRPITNLIRNVNDVSVTDSKDLLYKGSNYSNYCIDYLLNDERWYLSVCPDSNSPRKQPRRKENVVTSSRAPVRRPVATKTTQRQDKVTSTKAPKPRPSASKQTLFKCCPPNEDYVIEGDKLYCATENGGSLMRELNNRFKTKFVNQTCIGEVERFFLRDPKLIELNSFDNSLSYKNATYSPYCLEYEQASAKIMLVTCVERQLVTKSNQINQEKTPKILNFNENESSKITLPKCCEFFQGVARDLDTETTVCRSHTLLDQFLEKKYNDIDFIQNKNCQISMENVKSIDDYTDLLSAINQDQQILAGYDYCIDLQVKSGETYLFYC